MTGFEKLTFFVIHCAKSSSEERDPPLNAITYLGTQY